MFPSEEKVTRHPNTGADSGLEERLRGMYI